MLTLVPWRSEVRRLTSPGTGTVSGAGEGGCRSPEPDRDTASRLSILAPSSFDDGGVSWPDCVRFGDRVARDVDEGARSPPMSVRKAREERRG